MNDASILGIVVGVCVNCAVPLFNGNVLPFVCVGVAVDDVMDGTIE